MNHLGTGALPLPGYPKNTMTSHAHVIPIIPPCSLFKRVPVVITDELSVRTIKPEHLGAILAKDREAGSALTGQTKCILYSSDDHNPTISEMGSIALAVAFSLNMFANAGAIYHGACYIMRHTSVCKVGQVYELGSGGESSDRYRIDGSVGIREIKSVYDGTRKALDRHRKLAIAIRRFNTAMTRNSPEDRIIDLAVCLESIFDSQTEIAYKFSLYNSFLGSTNPTDRMSTFKLLKKFYRVRSGLVHGGQEVSTAWYQEAWPQLLKTAKLSLMSKIAFLADNNPNQWQDFLDGLVLGTQLPGEPNGDT